MGMNIKNPKTERLARELSSLTGEGLTEAVTKALEERLARVRRRDAPGVAARLIAIAKECGPLVREPFRTTPHGDLLHDEKGLPQ